MPVKPPVHRPVGWRDKAALDRDYSKHRDKSSLALMSDPAWRKARVGFLAEHPVWPLRSAGNRRRPHRPAPR